MFNYRPNRLSDGFFGFWMFSESNHATISSGSSFSKVTLIAWLLSASCCFVPRGLGQRKGCILQSVRGIAVALRLVFPLHALRSMATRIARRLQQRQRHLARDDAIDETHAVQGPRSARQTSFETAATHHSRFASRRFRALQPPSAEFCCEEMPWPWDSIGTPRCCRDLRNRLNHFARPSGASEP